MPDIKRLTIENFQSHEKTVLEFIPAGLNVIVGPSDSGKSAIIRALRWLFFNEPRGSDFVRVGARGSCRVTAELDDGSIVTRERDGNRNRYILTLPGKGRQVFEGFGSEPPAEVVRCHGITKVPLDTDLELPLNLAQQLEGPFLLSQTGAVRARAIGRISGVHILDAAIRVAGQRINQYEAERKGLLERAGQLEEELKGYEDLPGLWDRIQRGQEIKRKMEAAEVLVERLVSLRSELALLDEELSKTSRMLERLSRLDDAERRLSEAGELVARHAGFVRNWESLTQLEKGIAEARWILEATSGIERVGAGLEELGRLKERLEKLSDFWKELSRVNGESSRVDAALGRLESLPRVEEGLAFAGGMVRGYAELSRQRDAMVALEYELEGVGKLLSSTGALAEAGQHLETILEFRGRAERLSILRESWAEIGRESSVAEQVIRRTEGLDVVEESLVRATSLPGIIQQLSSLRTNLMRVEADWGKAREELSAAGREIHRLLPLYEKTLMELGKCPVCFGDITHEAAERILAEYRDSVRG